MWRYIFILSLTSSIVLKTQAQQEIGNLLFDHLRSDALILSDEGMIRGTEEVKEFVSEFGINNGKNNQYKKTFSIEVNTILDYELGEIQGKKDVFTVMFLKRKDGDTGPNIELLTIYKKEAAQNQTAEIDAVRAKWMKLCNTHQANELVKQLYQKEAYYYNQGRLLQGTNSISEEYGYMNSPGYSLKLTPKHVEFVTSNIVFEIGRCSGSYPNPYMILWEKQNDGNWQVLMDSNY